MSAGFGIFYMRRPTGGKIFVFCVSFQKMNDKMTAEYLLYYMLYIFFMKQYFQPALFLARGTDKMTNRGNYNGSPFTLNTFILFRRRHLRIQSMITC